MKNIFKNLVNRLKMAICVYRASRILKRTKAQFPGCENAMAMAWPTTGATGNGNAATGQYVATGTGTTLLWGTNNLLNITGFLTVTKVSQKVLVENIQLPNGDGLTAGTVQLIDGSSFDVEVRDDTAQVTSGLIPGQRISIIDGGGIVPGGARGASYSGIIWEHSWDTAPKTPAGRTLTVNKFALIT